jgi:hypothetical protein
VKQGIGFLILTGALLLAACATQGTAPASGSSVVNGTAPVSTAPVLTTNTSGSSAPAFKAPFGYETVVQSDGTVVYCRNDLDTSSRVARTRVCMTAAQLQAQQQNSQDFINGVQAHGAASTINSTPGGGGAY